MESQDQKLAREIAAFPITCMRNDRLSAIEQYGLDIKKALENEFEYGLKTLASGEYLKGSSAFTEGEGKHGKF